MKITVLTSGSRGDVQPYLALALGLHARGYEVHFAAPKTAQALVAAYGLRYSPIGAERSEMLQNEAIRKALATAGKNPFALITRYTALAGVAEQMAVKLLTDAVAVCQGTDLILCAAHNFYAGEAIAKKLQCRLAYIGVHPLTPTRTAPGLLFPEPPAWLSAAGRSRYHWLSHWLTLQPIWLFSRPRLNRLRQQVLGLPALPFSWKMITFRNGAERLHGYSAALLPRPADWSPNNHVCGYWFLDPPPGWQPAPALLKFLAAGPAPIFVGFSSVIDSGAREMTEWIVAALKRTGQRGILAGGWGGLAQPEQVPEHIYFVGEVPHAWLLPRCRAVLHHGGAGTTGAALRAGLPAVVIPYISDQFFWARKLYELGVAVPALPRKRVNPDLLARAIAEVVARTDLRSNAQALATAIGNEDGVGNAIAVLTASGLLR